MVGVDIEENEFKRLSVKNQNLVIYKVCSNMVNNNYKLKTKQKLLALSQAGIYALIGYIVYLHFD